jgi:hypothetical protein
LGVVLVAGGLALAAVGLVTVERHTGFFAPVWDAEGDGIYYVQRDSFGITWGFGWEHLSPPAYSYVVSDEFRLRHLDLDGRNRPRSGAGLQARSRGVSRGITGGGSSTRCRRASRSRRTARPIW